MTESELRDVYYRGWKVAEKEGYTKLSKAYEELYRGLLMKSLQRPYKQYIDELKAYPPIYLN